MKDGKEGYANRAPYNAIHVGAAAPGMYTCAKYCGNQKILAEHMDVCTSVGLILSFFYTIWVSIMRISHFV